MFGKLGVALTLVAAVAAAPAPLRAQDAASFYRGRQVTLIVPTGPGGGYALYGQILGPYLARHIPGHPTVVVQYMPGAGGNVAANYLYSVAPKDGSVIASLFSTLTVTQALHPTGAQFDATKFSWVGSIAHMVNAIGILRKASVETYGAAETTPVVMGATGKSADLYIYPKIMNALLGTKFKIVLGYDSTGAVLLAMQRGEAQGTAMGLDAWYALRPQWMQDHKVALIAQTGLKPDKLIQNVPTLVELARTPEEKRIMTFLASPAELGRVVAAPPGIPPDRLAALRKAFDATMQDADFRRDLASRHLSIDPTSGPQVAEFIKHIAATPKPLIDRTKALLGYGKMS